MKNNTLTIIVVSIIALTFPFYSSSHDMRFIEGITIHNKNVKGFTASEAYELLFPYVNDLLNQDFILVSPDKKKLWVTSYKKMGLEIDLSNIINDGLAKGNKGGILKRLKERISLRVKSENIPLFLTLNIKKAEEEIDELTKELLREAENAQLIISRNNEVTIKEEINGVGINKDKMIMELKGQLNLQGPLSMNVVTKVIEAESDKNDLLALNVETILAQYTTWFNPQKENRSENIKHAGKALDNFLLAPGEEFSFNKIVGPRTKEAGYNEAPIILNKRFVPGIGGGVCQVSSTLYNALLRGNIPVTERHPHSLLIHYVPKGMDAAVVYGLKDLKFTNNTLGHILVKSYVGDSSITIKLFGSKDKDIEVELLSIIEETIPPKIVIKDNGEKRVGKEIIVQEGDYGYIVKVERIIRDRNNEILIHEQLTNDYYPPVDRIISFEN